MNNKIIINDQAILLESPLLFLKGDCDVSSISGENLKIVEWNEYFPDIFENPLKLNKFIHLFPSILSSSNLINKEISSSTAQTWTGVVHAFNQLNNVSKVFPNILRINTILAEQNTIKEEITTLIAYQLKLKEITENSLYITKKDLLAKLQKELANLQPKFEIQKDEYSVYADRMQNYLKKKNDYNSIQKSLKEEQRVLFRQTNEITKMMDERDPSMQTYLDKLADLDPELQAEDYQRIQKKYNTLKVEYDKLKSHRNSIMNESKGIKQRLLKSRNEFKQSNKELRSFQPQFQEIEAKFLSLRSQIESLQKQIQEIESELNLMVDSGKSSSSNIDLSLDHIPYTSLAQVEELLMQKKERQNLILSKLDEIFHSTESSTISKDIENRISKMEDILKNVSSSVREFEKNDKIDSLFRSYIRTLKSLQNFMNLLLEPMDFQINFSNSIEGESNEVLKVNLILKNKKGVETNLEELKRVEKAYLILTLIVSCYLTLGIKLIPLEFKSLPPSIVTKQTFIKATQLLSEQILLLPLEEAIHVVFFMEQTNFDVSPTIDLSNK
ncbi:hypothetical protein [Candidatus Lokiarchaeum ossiferum]|uniref:hypothetical protein n=1 Tax=Candidatus Lokiarchaeum ossiferum TaxID=2951803 RepID=UPI00352F1512